MLGRQPPPRPLSRVWGLRKLQLPAGRIRTIQVQRGHFLLLCEFPLRLRIECGPPSRLAPLSPIQPQRVGRRTHQPVQHGWFFHLQRASNSGAKALLERSHVSCELHPLKEHVQHGQRLFELQQWCAQRFQPEGGVVRQRKRRNPCCEHLGRL